MKTQLTTTQLLWIDKMITEYGMTQEMAISYLTEL
jgi:hypothetical protein